MNILLIGCGRIGGAMARGWTTTGARVHAYDRDARLPPGVERIADPAAAATIADPVVVLAVKPQVFGLIAADLAPLAAARPLVLSVMAGVTLERLDAAFGGEARIVRAMPNTPAAIGRGITAAVPGPGVFHADRAVVDRLLAGAGAHLWLDDEAELDAVTAVSGSGPAYFFRMAEALARAGTEAGLPSEVAMRLARATFTGAAALADADPTPLAALREQVTSPGGTTAAGLARLDAGGAIDGLMAATVLAAAARSRELAD